MAVLIDNKQETKETYPTLFGFETKNGTASKFLNFIYIVVMVVAMAFAYHALSLILTDWNAGLVFLAALSVVGLPYCIKIIMYGRDEFDYNSAALCIAISLLPTIFDFVGFYSETSIKAALQTTKFEVLEKVNYFDKEARKAINKQLISLENDTSSAKTKAEQALITKQKEILTEINLAQTESEKKTTSELRQIEEKVNVSQQALIDETQGVKGKNTSGVTGIGPRAKELEADVRKAQAEADIFKKEISENKQKELDNLTNTLNLEQKEVEATVQKELERIQKEYEVKKASLDQGIKTIDDLVAVKDGEKGLVFEANSAKSFDELADVSIRLNNAINIISSKLSVEPKYIKFETDNVINLSFSALLRGEITAIICLLLALLLEVVDTVIVYMVRGVKKKPKKKIEENINKLKHRVYYNF